MAYSVVRGLIRFAEERLFLAARDALRAFNVITSVTGGDVFSSEEITASDSPDAFLSALYEKCPENLKTRYDYDGFCDIIMSELILSPSRINELFYKTLAGSGAKAATDMLYAYCVADGYVKRDRLKKNRRFNSHGLIITVNKAKPELVGGSKTVSDYPKCVICRENEGFAQNNKRVLRTIDIKLGKKDYFWQYSPFGYFNEHGIAINCEHTPMFVDKGTFARLIDFSDMFPHYFIGCNAALPRVGGSILAHDHYQGGGETLPLFYAPVRSRYYDARFPKATVGSVDWDSSVVCVKGCRDDVIELSERIRKAWTCYTRETIGIIAEDGDGVHNAVSPIVYKTGADYTTYIVLRSNITSDEFPLGVFHARPEYHCIKKESVGLIESQGLFVLPGRLEAELELIKDALVSGRGLPDGMAHFSAFYGLLKDEYARFSDADSAIESALGIVCRGILRDTAVFKTQADFDEFMYGAGFTKKE